MAGNSSEIERKNLSRALFNCPIVHIRIGPSKVYCGIHKNLLCHVSAYFNAALNGKFKEAETGTIDLDDEDPLIFQHFNGWLYTGIVLDETDLAAKNFPGVLIELYLFAEKRLIPRLQNDVVDAILHLAGQHARSFNGSDIRKIWESTAESSKLRKLAVDLYVYWKYLDKCLEDSTFLIDDFPPQFFFLVAQGLQGLLWIEDPDESFCDISMWKERCGRFHTHDKTDDLCGNNVVYEGTCCKGVTRVSFLYNPTGQSLT